VAPPPQPFRPYGTIPTVARRVTCNRHSIEPAGRTLYVLSSVSLPRLARSRRRATALPAPAQFASDLPVARTERHVPGCSPKHANPRQPARTHAASHARSLSFTAPSTSGTFCARTFSAARTGACCVACSTRSGTRGFRPAPACAVDQWWGGGWGAKVECVHHGSAHKYADAGRPCLPRSRGMPRTRNAHRDILGGVRPLHAVREEHLNRRV
jgi:hypothetical protein